MEPFRSFPEHSYEQSHIILLVINGILYTVTLKSSHHAWLAHDFCTIPWLSIDPHRFSQKFLHFDCPNSSATVGRPAAVRDPSQARLLILKKAPCESCIAVGDHPKNPENSPIQYLGSMLVGRTVCLVCGVYPFSFPKKPKSQSAWLHTIHPDASLKTTGESSRIPESQDFVVPAAFNQ